MTSVSASKRAVRRFGEESAAQAASAARRFGRATKGMAAIEMAFVFPVMLIAYFGLIDVTNLLSAKRRVTLASSTVADLVTQAPGSLTGSDLNGFYSAVSPILSPFPTSTVGVQIYDYQINGSNVSQRWSKSFGASCGAAPETTDFAALMTEGNDLVVARSCITLMPITGKVISNTSHLLSKDTALRPRQSLTLTCTGC